MSPSANPPAEWSETKNIRWKVEIPGRGSATPVVWGDHVYVLTAIPTAAGVTDPHAPRGGVTPRGVHRFVVMAINRKDGRIVWQQTAREAEPHEASHNDNGTWASSSALTDGEHVIAPFESQGLYAYDMNGKLVWQKDLGDKYMRNTFGEGSTPVLYKDRLFYVWDHQRESFIVALNKRTGEELWRVKRDEIDTWATPLVVEQAGVAQVVVAGMNRVRSYDAATGAIVWETAGLTMNPIPSPVSGGGMVFLMSGFRGNSLKAIRLEGAKGDITSTPAIAWTLDRDTPYVPSPLLYEGILYFLKTNNGLLTAVDAKTGKAHYQAQRLDAVPNVFASPVAAAGRIYIVGREGTTAVIKPGPTLEVLGASTLDDHFDASPALVDGEMYLRGVKNLYCVAQP
ncbi:MAG TPA: PQQ-binding-like beta-propeller repeat protein [Thermoanaerobaculia bacterium]|nr:PQQ-binding-like beta-propeller repeat protein [Thermoanaerobaculia bacterium]